jgi:hypothetical protein
MKSETIKCEILDQARELRNTRYKDVGIGPDQTRKQKQAELKLNEEADRKNREELTQEDRSKNLKWIVVGQRGEKRIVKETEREYNADRRAVGEGRQREGRPRQRSMEQRQNQERATGGGPGHGGGEASHQNKAITLLYANAQSINSKIDELKVISQDLDPNIILLTETWCNSTVENAALTIENYKLETDLRKDRCDTANGIGGGVPLTSACSTCQREKV